MSKVNILKTLDRSLHVLTLFDSQRPEWGVTELARHLDLPKSVIQKTLATFAGRGFLYQDEGSRRYRLGPRILSLARVAEPELARIAKPHLIQLAESAVETAKLTVLDGGETLIVAAVESRHSLHMDGRVGRRNPLYAGASNKLLAAYRSWSELEPVLRYQLVRDTPGDESMDERLEALRHELEQIAQAGYAMSTGEREQGVTAVVVPVSGHDGETLASLSIVGPAARMNEIPDDHFLYLLRQTSAAISRALGYDPRAADKGGDGEANSAARRRTS